MKRGGPQRRRIGEPSREIAETLSATGEKERGGVVWVACKKAREDHQETPSQTHGPE
ncbi:hypothetical protein RUM44_000010 [Polyplax serrata]|uniref:Uncharacterized protein n=1 Tax=Polyplax serrata TaxID=468196 RepID=A0ABR1B474_POLSC